MDANQRIHNDADQLADMYANLESRIFTEIIQVLQQGKRQDVTAENVIEWQAQQLAKSGLLVKKVIQIMAEYDQLDPAYIEQVLQRDGYQIVDETTAELEKLGKKAPEVSSNANNLLDSLVNQTRQTLDNTVNQRLLTRNINRNAAVRTYQSILKKSTIETVTGLKTHEQAIKDAIYKQIDEGIPVLKDRAGRTWSLEAYTRMVLTTTANRAYSDARTKRMQEMGQSLCVMTAHPNSRPACAYIQGKVVNIVPDDSPNYNPKYDTIYNHGYGTPAGTLGINCRHVLFPFEDGVNVNHQPQYDPQEAIKNGNLQQRQRAYERSIREAKKRLKAAEDMGDEEAISRYKTLVRARQNRLREFIKETNTGKHNILVRDYSREKIFPRKAIFEAEIERRTWVKDTASKINKFRVDTKVVNSQKFYKNVEDLKLSKKATEALYVKSLEFLNHRNGNVYEDLAAIDMRTGKIIEERTDMDEPFRVSFKGETKSNPRIFNEHVVLVHTHPGSSRPSVSDMGALHRRKAYASVVIGHDGSVRMIKNSKGLAGVEEKYEKLYNRYRKKKNLPKNLAETYAIDDVYRKVGYYGTRIKK